MGTTDDFKQAELLTLTKSVNITVDEEYPAMQVQYYGPALYAKIAVAAGGDIAITADDTDGETTTLLDIDLSTPGTGVDTFGELKDFINSQPFLRCNLLGAEGSLATDNKLDTLSVATIKGENGKTLFFDEDAGSKEVGFCITNQKFTYRPDIGEDGHLLGNITDELCINTLKYLALTLTSASHGSTLVYGCDDRLGVNTKTLLWTDAFVSATAEAHGATSPDTPDDEFLVAPVGQRLLVKFLPTTEIITSSNVTAIGSTKHTANGEVHGSNYAGCV